MAEIAELFQKVDLAGQLLSYALKPVFYVTGCGTKFVLKAGKLVSIELYYAGKAVAAASVDFLKGTSRYAAENGRLYSFIIPFVKNVEAGTITLTKEIEQRIKIKQILKDAEGNFIKDENGRLMAEAEVTNPDGSVSETDVLLEEAKEGTNDLLGSIVKNGNKVEYTNPAGKLLKWSEQSANDITNSINAAKNSTDVGRQVEGNVAKFIKQQGKDIEGFGLKIKDGVENTDVTDIDILTQHEIIEVKRSVSAWQTKPDQISRFVNSSLDDFVNPYNKKAILYIEKTLSALDKQKILNTIPSNVTLVNSLQELKLILK